MKLCKDYKTSAIFLVHCSGNSLNTREIVKNSSKLNKDY